MTVGELKAQLEQIKDQDLPVRFNCEPELAGMMVPIERVNEVHIDLEKTKTSYVVLGL